ncbi:MAG: dihydrofolate reductase family protein [Desulfobacterales bacterium]|jgi:dihydrofolate reductase
MKVILVMAMTLDGKIGKSPDHFPDWTGSADKRLFAEVSRRAGVVIMGSTTYATLKKPLPGRKIVVMTRRRNRVSKDSSVVFSNRTPGPLLKALEREGYREAVLAGGATINSLFAREGRIDEILVTVSPLIFGAGISLFSGEVDLKVELVDHERIDGGLLCLRYRVRADNPPKSYKNE